MLTSVRLVSVNFGYKHTNGWTEYAGSDTP